MQKKAIVIGATSGIGLEVAKLLAAKGWKVGIAGRRLDRLEQTAAETGGIAAYRQIDVTQEDAAEKLRELIDETGGMDLYFHSSGIGWQNEELDAGKEIQTVETNGVGFTRMVDAAFEWFKGTRSSRGSSGSRSSRGSRGHIACITSIAGTRGLGASPSYSATKRFQQHYLECLDQLARMQHLPINITDIRPGFVKTDLIAGSHYPMQLRAEDVARLIVRAIEHRKAVVTIDWKYRMLVALWRLIPRWMWVRMRVR